MSEPDSVFAFELPDEQPPEPAPARAELVRDWISQRRHFLAAAAAGGVGTLGSIACGIALLDASLRLPHVLTLLLPEAVLAIVWALARTAIGRARTGPVLATTAFRRMWAALAAVMVLNLATAIVYGLGWFWGPVVTAFPLIAVLPYAAYNRSAKLAVDALRRRS